MQCYYQSYSVFCKQRQNWRSLHKKNSDTLRKNKMFKLGCRKLGDAFNTGKTAASNILQNKQKLRHQYKLRKQRKVQTKGAV